jgi:hypothetical protein
MLARTDAHVQCGQAANGTTQIDKREDPYAPQQSNGCCIVM